MLTVVPRQQRSRTAEIKEPDMNTRMWARSAATAVVAVGIACGVNTVLATPAGAVTDPPTLDSVNSTVQNSPLRYLTVEQLHAYSMTSAQHYALAKQESEHRRATLPYPIRWGHGLPVNQTAARTDLRQIATGHNHGLGLKFDGTVLTWSQGNLGPGSAPAGLDNVTAVAAGTTHNLAVKRDGTVLAWGYNGCGQTTVPAGLDNVIAVAGGAAHSVALKNDGTVVAWGDNDFGQDTVPAGLRDVKAIAAGNDHTLALKNDGTVVAWGSDDCQQSTVPGGMKAVAIAAAGDTSMVLGRRG
jgi:alpha-tubulin suppressor-like RCC1 family protein